MSVVTQLGPQGYSKPPYGSFAGKASSKGTGKFTVLGPGGFSRPPYGSFAGKTHPIIVSELITDTTVLHLPINCVLDDQQDYEVGPTEIEARDPAIKTRVMVSQGSGGRLSSNESSFSVKTGSRGYD